MHPPRTLRSSHRLASCVGLLLWTALMVQAGAFTTTLTGSSPDALPALRALHPLVPRLLTEGQSLSPTFSRLVSELADAAGVVIYLDLGLTASAGPSGTLRFMAASGEHRFYRVQLETGSTAWPTDLRKLIVVLAHELWHVREAVQSGVSSGEQFEQLFQSIGTRVHQRTFETDAARNLAEVVRLEVYGVTKRGGASPSDSALLTRMKR